MKGINCIKYPMAAIAALSLWGCTADGHNKDEGIFPAITIQADAEHQTIDGFGASDCWRCQMVGKFWPEAKKNRIADFLFSQEFDENGNPLGIGLSMWRFNLGSGSSAQGKASQIPSEWKRNECFMNEDGTYDMNRQEGQQWFLKAAKERGVESFLVFSLSPPVHMTANGYAFPFSVGENMNIKHGRMKDYAEYMAESIKRLQESIGITIDWLSPSNEPQYSWVNAGLEATVANNAELSELTHYLSDELNERGLSTSVVLGEAGALKYLYGEASDAVYADNQIQEFWNPDSPINICNLPNVSKTISAHSYWSVWPVDFQVSERQTLKRALDRVPGLKYWQTEFCVMEDIGENIIPGGNGWQRDLGMETALFVARVIHNDLVILDAASWSWWTAITRADYKDGLVYLDDGTDNGNEDTDEYCRNDGYFRDSKIMWTLGNWALFVRPGMVRVNIPEQSSNPDSNVLFSAFKNPATGKIVFVAVNLFSVSVENATECSNLWIPYVTSSFQDMTRQENMNGDNMTLPPRSVVTFVLCQ